MFEGVDSLEHLSMSVSNVRPTQQVVWIPGDDQGLGQPSGHESAEKMV